MVHRYAILGSVRRLALCVCMAAAMHGILAAQGSMLEMHPHLFSRFYQDNRYLFHIAGNGDTIRPEWVAASYTFSMQYDSAGRTEYLFTECRRNQEPIRLAAWEDGRRVDTDAPLFPPASATVPIICHAGDTLSFYRELGWRHPVTGLQDIGNYYALDTLGFSVELVRLSDSTRAALLDSLAIMPNLEPGRPVIHGTRPMLAVVRYIVPPELDGVEAFLRVRAGHRGSGRDRFVRYDGMTINVSARVHDSYRRAFIDLFGRGEDAGPELTGVERNPHHPSAPPEGTTRKQGGSPWR